jgi:hypothetical protein
MVDKPSQAEEDFIAREEIEKRHKLAVELSARQQKADADALRQAHFMRCPKCGQELQGIDFRGVHVDRCFHCNGTWLDAGELELLAKKEPQQHVLQAIIDAFGARKSS